MEAKELRIGNLVNIKCGLFDDAKFEPCVIDFMELNEIHQKHREWIEYKPIPLTEEWLLKFGFESDDEFIFEKDIRICKTKQGYVYFDFSVMDPICDVKYVHQLQNLHFALTGEELELID